MRRHRADSNQAAIVKALRKAGCLVWPIGRPADLLVLVAAQLHLIDCEGSTKYRKRDPAQLANFAAWRVKVVKDEAEALTAVGL